MTNATTDSTTNIKTRIREYVEQALTVDSRQFDRLFTAILLLMVGTQLALSLNYKGETRLVPLIIGVPTFCLLTILLALQTSTRLANSLDGFSSTDVFGMENQVRNLNDSIDTARSDSDDPSSITQRRKDLALIMSWMIVFFGLIFVLGFMLSIPIFLLAFYRLQASRSWPQTLIFTLVVWGFVVVVFKVVLGSPLYSGLVKITLPF